MKEKKRENMSRYDKMKFGRIISENYVISLRINYFKCAVFKSGAIACVQSREI